MNNIIAPPPEFVTECKKCGHVLQVWKREFFVSEPDNCPSCGAYDPWERSQKPRNPWIVY
ncbi:hypothetical protein FACS1894167_05020 [Synergistales bacterium]|nr:hypothetical protein FACS1894167_05020 [Synergistales bacterium]